MLRAGRTAALFLLASLSVVHLLMAYVLHPYAQPLRAPLDDHMPQQVERSELLASPTRSPTLSQHQSPIATVRQQGDRSELVVSPTASPAFSRHQSQSATAVATPAVGRWPAVPSLPPVAPATETPPLPPPLPATSGTSPMRASSPSTPTRQDPVPSDDNARDADDSSRDVNSAHFNRQGFYRIDHSSGSRAPIGLPDAHSLVASPVGQGPFIHWAVRETGAGRFGSSPGGLRASAAAVGKSPCPAPPKVTSPPRKRRAAESPLPRAQPEAQTPDSRKSASQGLRSDGDDCHADADPEMHQTALDNEAEVESPVAAILRRSWQAAMSDATEDPGATVTNAKVTGSYGASTPQSAKKFQPPPRSATSRADERATGVTPASALQHPEVADADSGAPAQPQIEPPVQSTELGGGPRVFQMSSIDSDDEDDANSADDSVSGDAAFGLSDQQLAHLGTPVR